jgi:hypothetical protein
MNTTKKILGALGVAALLVAAHPAHAVSFNLGVAGPQNFGLLNVGDGTVTVENTTIMASFVYGNAGIASNEKLTMSGGSQINGNLYLGNTATTDFSGGSGVTGTTFLNQDTLLNQARTDAINASTAAAALPGQTALGNVTASQTLTPGAYSLTGLDFSAGDFLTLNGAGTYIFNISGDMLLSGDSGVLLTGGATEGNVLFNIVGTLAENHLFHDSGNSVVRGIVLNLNGDIIVDGGLSGNPPVGVFGEVIGGQDITIKSGSSVQQVVPDAGSTFALMGIGMAMLAAAKRKFLS